jgi:hypothetical protein
VKVVGSGSEWPGDVCFDPFATNLFALQRTPLCAKSELMHRSNDPRYSITWSRCTNSRRLSLTDCMWSPFLHQHADETRAPGYILTSLI